MYIPLACMTCNVDLRKGMISFVHKHPTVHKFFKHNLSFRCIHMQESLKSSRVVPFIVLEGHLELKHYRSVHVSLTICSPLDTNEHTRCITLHERARFTRVLVRTNAQPTKSNVTSWRRIDGRTLHTSTANIHAHVIYDASPAYTWICTWTLYTCMWRMHAMDVNAKICVRSCTFHKGTCAFMHIL